MYTLSMWNSYLFVASLDVFIVLLAGLISIVSARRSQKAIEKVCNCSTLVTHQNWLLCYLINCLLFFLFWPSGLLLTTAVLPSGLLLTTVTMPFGGILMDASFK